MVTTSFGEEAEARDEPGPRELQGGVPLSCVVAAVGPHFLTTLPRAVAARLGAAARYWKGRSKNSGHPGGSFAPGHVSRAGATFPWLAGGEHRGRDLEVTSRSPAPLTSILPAHCIGRVCDIPSFSESLEDRGWREGEIEAQKDKCLVQGVPAPWTIVEAGVLGRGGRAWTQ